MSETETDISPVKTAYELAVSEGKTIRDISQEKAVEILDALCISLVELQTKTTEKKSFLKKLFSRKNKADDVPEGVYLYGPAGRGKSFIMDLFYGVVPVDKKRRINFHEFMTDVHDALHVYRQQGISSEKAVPTLAAQLVKESRLICFDELTVTEVADSMILYRLFEEMFNAGLVVVATSGVIPENLYRDGVQRERFNPFIELIKRKMKVVQLSGKIDYRLERLRGCQVYHTPANSDTRNDLDAIFARLTEHDTVEKRP